MAQMDFTHTISSPISTTASRIQITTSTPSEDERTPPPRIQDGTLRLRGGPIQDRRVTWGEDVIDNEELGRKKSKVCCIFRRARSFGESSSEDSSSDSDSSGSDIDISMEHDGDRARPIANSHSHGHCRGKHSYGRKSQLGPKRPPSPNAYEKMPKAQRKN
ncbi:type 1 phosphatases regulator YPI1 [Tirmania nivea]|nr:type 1 phosphatases regulator YPI1 [Tirmania nivea]